MNLEENNGVPAPGEPVEAPSSQSDGAVVVADDGAAAALSAAAALAQASLEASAEVPEGGAGSEAPAGAAAEQSPPAPPPVVGVEPTRLRRHHVAPAMIALDRIDDDRTFQIRPEGDIHALATDIARLGQLFPIDIRFKPPDRFQVICGFRRVAALRFLQRDRVLARLHSDLTDEDALLMALVSAIHARPVTPVELEQVKQRLESEGRLTPSIRSMIEKALSPEDGLAPETVGEEQEVEADQLADDVTHRLGEINQDLSLLADVFDSLDPARQEQLLEQLRYSSELVAYLEGRK